MGTTQEQAALNELRLKDDSPSANTIVDNSSRSPLVQVVTETTGDTVEPVYTLLETKDDVQVTVFLPDVCSVAEIDLNVSENHLQLDVIHVYRLTLPFACSVMPDPVKAKFVTKTSKLKLKFKKL